MREEKSVLRKKLKSERDRLTKEEIIAKSKLISQRLFNLKEFQQAKTVMFYVSFGSEVNTQEMIKKSLKLKKQVVVPKVNKNPKGLSAIKITNIATDLVPGSYGILEPKTNLPTIEPEQIDLVLVPGLGFDYRGRRIGYGGGYYDCWLKHFPIRKRIGLAFDSQIFKEIPTGKSDMKLGKLITESKTINCIPPERNEQLWK